MRGLGEEVHRLHALEAPAVAAEPVGVAGEGGRVAGDVDDAPERGGHQGLEHGFRAAGPGRIQDGRGRLRGAGVELAPDAGQYRLHLPHLEADVPDPSLLAEHDSLQDAARSELEIGDPRAHDGVHPPFEGVGAGLGVGEDEASGCVEAHAAAWGGGAGDVDEHGASVVDSSVRKGVLTKNKAARVKSRLAQKVNALGKAEASA